MSVELNIHADVERIGWSAILVTDEPPFAYTVGLMFTFSHPELIIFGLRDQGHPILTTMVEVLREGGSLFPTNAILTSSTGSTSRSARWIAHSTLNTLAMRWATAVNADESAS